MVPLNVLAVERLWKITKHETFVKNLMEFHLNGMLFFHIISSFFEWIYKQTFAKNLAKFGQKTSSSLILHSKRVVKFSALQHYVQKWYVTWFRTKFFKVHSIQYSKHQNNIRFMTIKLKIYKLKIFS